MSVSLLVSRVNNEFLQNIIITKLNSGRAIIIYIS